MRVIAGTARGTKLDAVPGDTTRPILDRVKTALFDILRPRLSGARVLDLFGGSGAIGIEALSQGAEHCTFLDLSRAAVETIRANLTRTHLLERADVRHFDAFSWLRNSAQAFDLIFVAPPQYQALWVQALHLIAERPQLVTPGGQVIVQIDPREYEPLGLTDLTETGQRSYGNTLLVFFERNPGPGESA